MKNIKEFCLKIDITYADIEETWLNFKAKRIYNNHHKGVHYNG